MGDQKLPFTTRRVATSLLQLGKKSAHAQLNSCTCTSFRATVVEKPEEKEVDEKEAVPAEDGEQEEVEKEEAPRASQAPANKEGLRNQFNFSERAAQTNNNPYRVRGL